MTNRKHSKLVKKRKLNLIRINEAEGGEAKVLSKEGGGRKVRGWTSEARIREGREG